MQKWRVFCLLLACVLCVSCWAAAEEEGGDSPSFLMAGFDNTQYRDWQNNQFFLRMEEKTGVHLVLRQSKTEEDWAQVKSAMAAGDDGMADVLFKASLTTQECIALREKGVLIDLKPYLESCCPNLWALIQKEPEILAAITLPDGSIAALPYITPIPMQNYLWINQKWLDSLRLSAPTNAEELTQVLTAFRDRDPNHNGRQDEIPLSFQGPFDLKFLAHAFGLIANDYNVFVENGQVKFMPLEDGYRQFVAWCRELYKEKLLDQNGFITTVSQTVTDSKATPNCGIVMTYLAGDTFRVSWATDYVILNPMTYQGEQIYREFAWPVSRGTFAITSACKDPETMLRWVDTLYTEEGATLALVGQENVDYLVDGDGTWRMPESQQNEAYRASANVDGGGRIPGIENVAFQARYGADASVRAILESQMDFAQYVRRPFPYYTLTQAQLEEITPLQAKIATYVDMQLARWVLGEEEISDASFAQFESTLNEMGLRDFLAFWQDVLDHQ